MHSSWKIASVVLLSALGCSDSPAPEVPLIDAGCRAERCGATDAGDPTGQEDAAMPPPADEPGPLGAPCVRDEDCESDHCSTTFRCGPLPLGAPCTVAEDCLEAYCKTGGTCGHLRLGADCDPAACLEGPCDCGSGFCSPDSERCANGDESEPCDDLGDCRPGYACPPRQDPTVEPHCQKLGMGALGDLCDTYLDCTSQVCQHAGDDVTRCGPLLTPGESCTRDEACRSNHCNPDSRTCTFPLGAQCGVGSCSASGCAFCDSDSCRVETVSCQASPFGCELAFCD